MAIVSFSHKGDFSKTTKYFARIAKLMGSSILDKYGQQGVEALRMATPKDTGLTSESWRYGVEYGPESSSVYWYNTNENKGVNIAVILQYGHGTKNGGYVKGIDYINPAIKPILKNS